MRLETEITIAKIGDLGVAKAVTVDGKYMSTIPGTVPFMPPEAFVDSPVYNTSLDVFSYGAVVLFVATHKWPVPDAERNCDPESKRLVALTEVQRRQKYLDQMNGEMEELKPLVEHCLSYEPNKRPTMCQVSEMLKSLKLKVQLMQLHVVDHIMHV